MAHSTFRESLPPAPRRPVPALQCYLAYVAALAAGAAGWLIIKNIGLIEHPYWIGFAVTCISTGIIWIFSVVNDNSSIYDPYWVIAPPFLALALKAGGSGFTGPWHPRQVLVLICLILWASRYHIFYAWSGWRTGLVHEDWRYEQMRNAPVPYWLNSLIGMHFFPTVLVYFAFAPAALALISSPGELTPFGVWDCIATAGALTAVMIELIADRQLQRYRQTGEYEQGGTFRGGIWKYSRHPNYFGEALFWVSMIPFAAAVLPVQPVLMLTGPILMALFFRFSCRLTDIRSLERRPGYPEVINQVSAMVPWPRRELETKHSVKHKHI